MNFVTFSIGQYESYILAFSLSTKPKCVYVWVHFTVTIIIIIIITHMHARTHRSIFDTITQRVVKIYIFPFTHSVRVYHIEYTIYHNHIYVCGIRANFCNIANCSRLDVLHCTLFCGVREISLRVVCFFPFVHHFPLRFWTNRFAALNLTCLFNYPERKRKNLVFRSKRRTELLDVVLRGKKCQIVLLYFAAHLMRSLSIVLHFICWPVQSHFLLRWKNRFIWLCVTWRRKQTQVVFLKKLWTISVLGVLLP